MKMLKLNSNRYVIFIIFIFLINFKLNSQQSLKVNQTEINIIMDTTNIFKKFIKPEIPQSLINYTLGKSADTIYQNPSSEIELFFFVCIKTVNGSFVKSLWFNRLNYYKPKDTSIIDMEYETMWRDSEKSLSEAIKQWEFEDIYDRRNFGSICFIISMAYDAPVEFIDRFKILRIR